MLRNGKKKLSLGLVLVLPVFSLAYTPSKPEPEVSGGAPEFNQFEESKSASLGYFSQAQVADSAHDYDVTKYIIDLKLVPASPASKVTGRTTIQAKSQIDNLITVVLDFVGMTIDSCKVNSVSTSYTRSVNQLFVDLQVSYDSGGSFAIDVFYHGNPSGGLYFSTNDYGTAVYYTFAEPYAARYWFPCYDLPSDKARCEVKITLPSGNYVVSNGILYRVTDNGDETTTYHWKENYFLSTYLISFSSSSFAQLDTFAIVAGDTLPVQYRVYPQDSSKAVIDFKKTPEMIEYFSDLWYPYPFPGDKYCMVQAELAGAMEHQTCTSWGVPMTGDARYEHIVAHELAHHWWGNQVTCNDFANIWLNEGFASYAEVLWIESEYGTTAKRNHLAAFEGNIYASRNGSVKYPIYNPPETYLFGTAVYKKGAWVLHMLRYLLGDSLSFGGLKAYGQQYSYGTANTEQFKATMEGYSGQDLDWFFDQWVYSPNYPRHNWSWVYTSIAGKYYLDVSLKQTQSTPALYTLPIEFKLSTAAKDTFFTIDDTTRELHFNLVLNSQPTGLFLDPDYWILTSDTLTAYPHLAGDLDGNSLVLLGDMITLINTIFRSAALPSPAAAADVNGDCRISLADVIHFVNYFYRFGPPPKQGCP
ncbi:MAG: hypothetical protein A2Z27_05660 [candidate division Zixibacteria bacterium RBG_16_50_21]|nr:MAG: hypothetical protein A2Z27_05660 [candidate division Zixibacteria bacterium RBG_16_50_21]